MNKNDSSLNNFLTIVEHLHLFYKKSNIHGKNFLGEHVMDAKTTDTVFSKLQREF